jgi:site-specific DNA-methyltransferase (cytosine-N4-specific)
VDLLQSPTDHGGRSSGGRGLQRWQEVRRHLGGMRQRSLPLDTGERNETDMRTSALFEIVPQERKVERDTRRSVASGRTPRHRVELGDAFDLFRTLTKGSVDLVITSPPYWGHRTYSQEHNWHVLKEWESQGNSSAAPPSYDWYRKNGGVLGLEPLPDWFTHHLAEIFDAAHSCLKPGGSMWINLGDTYFARWSSIRLNGRQGLGDNPRERRRTPMGGYRQEKQLLLIPSRFAIAMQERRWILRNDLIWYKPNVPPRPERDRMRLSHEHFFHFVKRAKIGRPKYYYDLDKVEPRATDVVTCNVRAGQDGHSATFPNDLIRPRIESSCPPRGTVVDPFCGTGRALVMALKTGRKAVGFDVVPDYVEAARRACDALIVADAEP